jgi:hypothetical protein
MAVASVSFDGTRIDHADALGTLWDDLGGGKTNLEPDFVYQRASGVDGAVSEKIGTTEGGVKYYDSGTTTSFSTNSKTWIAKHIATNKDALNNIGVNGGILEIGSGDRANYYRYYIVGGDTYPKRGGWLISPINPNVTAHRDNTIGTPALGSVDNYNWACDFNATSKAENVAMDAIDVIDNGTGLTLVGGDGASADGVFDDFVSTDEGTLANSWGIVQTFAGTVESGMGITGTLTIGSATATVFNDSNKALFFFGGRVAAGFSGLDIDLGNSANQVDLTNCSFTGLGVSDRKQFFDSTDSLNATTDLITTDQAHGYETGEAVLYSKEGGTAATGLTDATEYWVEVASATTFAMHTSRQNAITAATRVALTPAGTENHSVTRQPDTRPDYTVTNTTGIHADATGCLFVAFRTHTLNADATLEGCTLVNCGDMVLGGGTLTDCTVNAPTTTEGVAYIVTATPAAISGASFIAGDEGHALEITSTTGSPFTYSGNTHTGYWAPADLGWNFITSAAGVDGTGEVITTDAAHGFTTGEAVYYNDEGGVASVGLTDGAKYYVNVITTTTLSLHRSRQNAVGDTNRVNLTASGAETHSLYSGRAAVFNDSAGSITLSVAGGGDSPSVRNGTGASTTVSNDKSVTFTGLKDNSEVRVYNASTGAEIAGIEDATAGSPDDRTFQWSAAAGLSVNYVIHNFESGVTVYQSIRVNGFSVPSVDTLLPVQQVIDRNVE